MSRTAIKELTAAYRAVLKHAFIAMVGAMVVVGGASAGDEKTQIKVESGETMELAAGQVYDGYTTTGKGAVASVDGTLTVGSNSVFSNNKSEYIGGAIVNSGTLNIGNNTKFIGNTAIAEDGSLFGGGALFSFGGLVNINEGTLFENNLSYLGGAIVNYGGKLTANKTIFRKNVATKQGGAIDVEDGSIEINNSVFVENDGANSGGAISSVYNSDDGHIDIKGSEFTSNSAEVGGAIGAYKFLTVSNSMFKGNYTTANSDGGGAIVIGGHGKVDIADTSFDGNKASIGGAIATRPNTQEGLARGDEATSEQNKDGHWLTIANAVFKNNVADAGADNGKLNGYNSGSFGDGGAIWTGFVGSTVDGVVHSNFIAKTTFENNIAKNSGGAIYNEGINKITDSTFVGNIANKDGGAIFNAVNGELTLDGNNVFIGNSANGFGGAVGSKGQLTLKGTTFANNTASVGGAMYSGYNDFGVGRGSSEISGATFTNNSAEYGAGAVANYGSMKIDIDNTKFVGNKVTHEIEQDGWNNRNLNSSVDGGGALFVGSASTTSLNKTVFQNNSSTTAGGAIATRADWVNSELGALQFKTNAPENYDPSKDYLVKNTKAKLDIKNSVFERNTAGLQGGALFNTFMNTTIADSNFVGNVAGQGGAIYNAGAIELSGNNVFTGNMAGGVGNDIHNLGKLTVSDGTTTIDGGITGDGALTIADGATLNIGTATVAQDTLTLEGTVGLTIVDANNYGKLLAKNYDGNGTVSLNVATTGTYNIFSGETNYSTVDAGAIYDVTAFADGTITIATKSVDKIVADTGLTDVAANTVAGLANTDNALANIASLNAQQALRDGDTEYVERETARMNPMDKPVVQSMAQSVQGQVATLAANRMSGTPAMGRNGGDINAEYGVWAQGMFNKSKFNGQFNGYTRGIAAGVDALVDNQYTVGLGYAFGHSDINADDGRNTEIDSNSIFAYAQYKPSDWYINATLNYTMSKYTGSHDAFGVNLKSDYDVNAFGVQAMTGYDFASGMTPEVGVRYLHVSQDSYDNGLAHVDGDDTDFLTGIAGLNYRFAIENGGDIHWFPELRAAATYDFVSDRALSTITMPGAAAYVVDGDRLSRFGGEFGIGLTAEYTGVEISLNYDLDLHEDYTSQTGMLKFRYEF